MDVTQGLEPWNHVCSHSLNSIYHMPAIYYSLLLFATSAYKLKFHQPAECQDHGSLTLRNQQGGVSESTGYFNHVPVHNYLSGDGKSHVYYGPAHHVPSERAWISYADYRSLPRESRRDAILMESEDQWREFQAKRDSVHPPSGISVTGYPDLYRRNPLPQLLPFRTKAWIRKWDGPGYFYPPEDSWIHEPRNSWINGQEGPGIPDGSYRFYNEEDWAKFKYMSETPKLDCIKLNRSNVPLPPNKTII